MADGYPTNFCALQKILKNFGLLSPSTRCVSNAADNAIKQMVNSRSMNVPAVSQFQP